jgi:radical SAM superfamily enzyme YgiQ (UPF0313 family)
LVNPYITTKKNERLYPVEPLGLLSLATYVNEEIKKKSLDIEIKILDAKLGESELCIRTKRGYRSGLSDDEISNFLKKYNPNLVGIANNYTNHVQDVLELSTLVKNECPNCTLILGGAHATIGHENLIKTKEVDAIVRGEGEETFKEIILSLYENKDFKKILGVTYKENGQIKINDERPLIEDINTLPIPDRSLIPYKKYLEKTSKTYFLAMNMPIATLFTSRGCPFRCIFCSTHTVWSNKWRARSPENMLKEIKYLMRTYGVKEIAFQDDQFMGDKTRIINLCKLVIKEKLSVSFIVPSGISPALVDEETLDLMKKAGFYRIGFSIDVGTKAAREYVRKPVNLEKIRDLMKKANSKGFWTYGKFVIGFPFEKVEDIHKTIKYAYSLKLDFLRFYVAQPHLGSDLYDIYLKEGKIDLEWIGGHHLMYESTFGTDYVSPAKLMELRDSAEFEYQKFHLRHFLNPIYLIKEFIPKISSTKKFAYFIGSIHRYIKGEF